jgi:hypothetical protein
MFGPVDYELLAERVKDKLIKGSIYKVLSAKDLQVALPNCIGVGTPFIVRDLDTDQPYMLFTAWNDVNGLARQIWVAPIDEDLIVDTSKAKKIADGRLFNVTGLNTVHAYWDDFNNQWVLFSTFYGGPAGNVAGAVFVDSNFNVRGSQTLTFTKADGTSVDLGDAGISPVPLYNKAVLLSAGAAGDRGLFLLSDGTRRPLSNPSQINYATVGEVNKPFRIAPTYFLYNIDVHQLLLLDQGLVMLSELTQYRNQWFIQVYYGAEKDWFIGTTVVPTFFVAPISPPFPIHFTDVVGNIGHPHYTNLLKEPYLFFARFPTWNWGGNRAWAHDIWVARIDPNYLFSPRGKVLVANGGQEPYTHPNLIPIPTFGARTATIYLFKVSASGTLTLTESGSPYHIYKSDGDYVQTTYSVSSGGNKIIINAPAPWIALGLDVNLYEWMVVLDC